MSELFSVCHIDTQFKLRGCNHNLKLFADKIMRVRQNNNSVGWRFTQNLFTNEFLDLD